MQNIDLKTLSKYAIISIDLKEKEQVVDLLLEAGANLNYDIRDKLQADENIVFILHNLGEEYKVEHRISTDGKTPIMARDLLIKANMEL